VEIVFQISGFLVGIRRSLKNIIIHNPEEKGGEKREKGRKSGKRGQIYLVLYKSHILEQMMPHGVQHEKARKGDRFIFVVTAEDVVYMKGHAKNIPYESKRGQIYFVSIGNIATKHGMMMKDKQAMTKVKERCNSSWRH